MSSQEAEDEAGIRDVAIPPHLLSMVRAHLLEHAAAGRDGLLFPGKEGGHLAPSTLYGRAAMLGKDGTEKRKGLGLVRSTAPGRPGRSTVPRPPPHGRRPRRTDRCHARRTHEPTRPRDTSRRVEISTRGGRARLGDRSTSVSSSGRGRAEWVDHQNSRALFVGERQKVLAKHGRSQTASPEQRRQIEAASGLEAGRLRYVYTGGLDVRFDAQVNEDGSANIYCSRCAIPYSPLSYLARLYDAFDRGEPLVLLRNDIRSARGRDPRGPFGTRVT